MYSVIESVDSEDLALYVCLTADSVDRPFSVTLSPLSGTATGIVEHVSTFDCVYCVFNRFLVGNDFVETPTVVDIPVGNSVRVCGCVGLIDDTNLESSETFNIAATINDPIMTSSAPLSTVVLVQDDPTDSKKTRTLSFAPLTFSVCVSSSQDIRVWLLQGSVPTSEDSRSVTLCVLIQGGSVELTVQLEFVPVGGLADGMYCT